MRKPLLASFLVLLLIFCLPGSSLGQLFGGNPPSLKWKQINTDTVRIIFPAGLDSQAKRISSIVHYITSNPSLSFGDKLKKINIVIQNHTTIANGYVGLGPFRSEFFLNPAMNNFDQGSVPWADQLALHEYRHVQQFNNFRRGLSQVAYVLFGEDGLTLAVNAAIPDWFYEGDAVYNETILSNQGRGRLPSFLNTYPSLWRAGKKYSWMKLRNGSLKDYVPSHYNLGYLLVNYGREKYGMDFWNKVTQDAAAFKGLIYPFQKAIKKHAGIDYKTFYNDAFAYYKKMSSDLTQSLSKGEGLQSPAIKNIFPVNKQVVTNYFFPYSISEDSLLYLKTSYDKRPAFYIKDKEGEHRLRARDISMDEQFSYRNGMIVYASYESHPRWRWWDYSVIKLLDIRTNVQRTIRSKTKYFTPDISPSGEKIVAVEVAAEGKSELHVLDAVSGEVTTAIKSAEISLFTDPKFIDDNSLICVVRLQDGKTALAISDLTSGSIERLTPPSYNVVGYPNINNGMVYFSASFGGNDDVFALRLSEKKIYKITSGPLGNYFVNAGNGKITWSAFTAECYQLQQMDEKNVQLLPVNESMTEKVFSTFPVSHDKEVTDVLLKKVVQRDFAVEKYSKGKGLFNFHSWRPYYENPEFTFTLYGENILNTLRSELYYLYNRNDNTHATGVNFVYGQLFPYLNIGSQYTFDYQAVSRTGRVKQWDQLDSRIGLNIPLSWAQGRMFNNLNFGSSYVYSSQFNKGPNKNIFTEFRYSYLSHFITWSQQVQMARQHIYPKWGYSATVNYRHAIGNYSFWQPLLTGAIYLPGFLSTHSIVLTGAFQDRDADSTIPRFPNRFSYSRGYNPQYEPRMTLLSANYNFPLLYPDWGFGNILYLHRIRANVFYDFTELYNINKEPETDQRSVGAEIYVDTNWWNQYPLTFGFRVTRLLDYDQYTKTKGFIYEFIMPVSIFPR